jgi:hypothetical protein
MITTAEQTTHLTQPAHNDRRLETRECIRGDLWMVDHNGGTVLRCRCVDVSEHGMRLKVPLGYGVADNQRYELRSHLPGGRRALSFGVIGRRWATVVRTRVHLGGGEDHLEVGVVLDDPGMNVAWNEADRGLV